MTSRDDYPYWVDEQTLDMIEGCWELAHDFLTDDPAPEDSASRADILKAISELKTAKYVIDQTIKAIKKTHSI